MFESTVMSLIFMGISILAGLALAVLTGLLLYPMPKNREPSTPKSVSVFKEAEGS